MRVTWCYASRLIADDKFPVEQHKSIGPSWGSYKTWRMCGTDNVVCHDLAKCQELINRAFHAVCNFYVPKKFYQMLDRPVGIKLYDGEFDLACNDIEDVISMHLAASCSDIILLSGFNLSVKENTADRLEKHMITNYHGLIRSVLNNNPQVQWVLVDHESEVNQAYQNISNLTCDNLGNVLQLLL